MKVFFYETSGGNSPIKKFIDGLPESDQASFFEVVTEIEKYGLSAVRVIFKPLEGKLWEIKFRSVQSSFRVAYVILEKDVMTWLHAFKKKTQKTPKQDLEIARKRMKEVLR